MASNHKHFSFRLVSVPKMIQGYNGKPALVTKSGNFKRNDNYIEFTINVNLWAFLARKGLHTLTPKFPDFVVNVGFTIEARSDEEMPGESSPFVSLLRVVSYIYFCSYFTLYLSQQRYF